MADNEVVDELANEGAKLPQDGIPVTHVTAKARIKRTKWEVTHPRAKEIYGDRSMPKVEIERKWVRKVRTLFSLLRTDHAPKLKQYMYKIEGEDGTYCLCEESEENIRYVLCHCPSLARARAMVAIEQLEVSHMISDPERCWRVPV